MLAEEGSIDEIDVLCMPHMFLGEDLLLTVGRSVAGFVILVDDVGGDAAARAHRYPVA